MKKHNVIIGAIVLAVSSFTANAALTSVGGVTWDPDYDSAGPPPTEDLDMKSNFSQWFVDTSVAGIYDASAAKDVLTVGIGDELQGSGRFTEFNGFLNPTLGADPGFCLTCELTYEFGGLLSDGVGGFTSTDAFLNIYVETGVDINGDYDDGAGALWLGLTVATLDFTATVGSAQYLDGFVSATFNAMSGLAMPNFDTNTVAGGADIAYAASAIFRLENVTLPYDSTTNQYLYTTSSTAGFTGDSVAVPEPNTLALAGLALLAVGGLRRRRFNK